MDKPVDMKQRTDSTDADGSGAETADSVATPRVSNEPVPFAEDGGIRLDDAPGRRDSSSRADDADILTESSNEITTIVIDDTEDSRKVDEDLSDGASDSHQHELRSKIAQQLWADQCQNQQQMQQQQQQLHRRHRAKSSRNHSINTKVNSSFARLKRTASKINSQGSLIELISDASDHDGDIDNSDNGYEEEDKDSDDRDHDVRDIYNQAKLTTNSNANSSAFMVDIDTGVSLRADKSRHTDRLSSLRFRPRRLRNSKGRSRQQQEHEDQVKSAAYLDADTASREGTKNRTIFGIGLSKNADHNNNTQHKHFIDSNNHSSSTDQNGRIKLERPSQSKKTLYKCSECKPAPSVLTGTLSRVFSLIHGQDSSLRNPACEHLSEVSHADESDGNIFTKHIMDRNGEKLLIQDYSSKTYARQGQQELVTPTSGKRKRSDMPNASNYQSFAEPRARKSFKSSRQRDVSNHDRNFYTKLGHSYHQRSSPSSLLHEFKRFFLLLVIIALCSFVLWQIYQVLIEEENYLGAVKYSPSELGNYEHYAVSTDAAPCAKIGKDLLARGGHAVDAAIGTLICMGVVLPNSLGLGGGCLMTIYDNKTKIGTVIDGRETAPDYATENMFADNPLSSSRGPLSVGVPGELAAYWEAHQRFGRLNWSDLFDSSIELAETGFNTVDHLSFALRDLNHAKYITKPLADILTNNATGEYYFEGEIMYQRELARTLRRIRDNGVTEFYGGPTGQMFVDDLRKQGGMMTLDNLRNYRALVKNATEFRLNDDLKILTQPVPGSGLVLGIILRIMQELGYYKNLKPKMEFESASLYYHHLVEAFKFAYAQRAALEESPDDPARLEELLNKLSSDKFIKDAVAKITDDKTHPSAYYGGLEYFQEDHGTAHTSVIDNEGNSVAITTSVNLYFGSGLVSPSTGIIYNDVMDDFVSPNITNKFQLPPTKYNRIRPGKRPLSSMAPSVFVDGVGNPKLLIGSSGGSKITTSIAMVALRHLFFDESIKAAIDSSRIHHQFLPDQIMFEGNFPPEILDSLANRGHQLGLILGRSSVVMAIACDYKNATKFITANSDYRKGGSVAGA